MAKQRDMLDNLSRIEEELLAMEPDPVIPEEQPTEEPVMVEAPNKKIGGLLLLAILEMAGIYAIIRWWLQWL